MKYLSNTQGLLEVHQKLTKNVVPSSKLGRIDTVIQELKSRKISSHRNHKVVKSKHQPKIKLFQETFFKRRRKRRTCQIKFNEKKFQKNHKNKVALSSPTSTSEPDQTSDTHQDEIYLNNKTNVHLSDKNKDRKTPDTLELNQETFSKRRRKRGPYEKKLNVKKLHKINKKKVLSSSPTLTSERDDISEMHQEKEISMNSGTETDLSEINQNEARFNREKAQETPKNNFLQKNQNYDEVTTERKDALREKCPNTEFLLVYIFPYSNWIRENTDQKKLRIWTLFTQ